MHDRRHLSTRYFTVMVMVTEVVVEVVMIMMSSVSNLIQGKAVI